MGTGEPGGRVTGGGRCSLAARETWLHRGVGSGRREKELSKGPFEMYLETESSGSGE